MLRVPARPHDTPLLTEQEGNFVNVSNLDNETRLSRTIWMTPILLAMNKQQGRAQLFLHPSLKPRTTATDILK